MFSKLFDFLGKAKAAKDFISQFLQLLDRADDDLDKDGKSELQNIKEDLDALLVDVIADGKAHYAILLRIYNRAKVLIDHVKGV